MYAFYQLFVLSKILRKCNIYDLLLIELRVVRFSLYSWSTNGTPASRLSDFVNHSYDYRPNWTPLSPFNITNFYFDRVLIR